MLALNYGGDVRRAAPCASECSDRCASHVYAQRVPTSYDTAVCAAAAAPHCELAERARLSHSDIRSGGRRKTSSASEMDVSKDDESPISVLGSDLGVRAHRPRSSRVVMSALSHWDTVLSVQSYISHHPLHRTSQVSCRRYLYLSLEAVSRHGLPRNSYDARYM